MDQMLWSSQPNQWKWNFDSSVLLTTFIGPHHIEEMIK